MVYLGWTFNNEFSFKNCFFKWTTQWLHLCGKKILPCPVDIRPTVRQGPHSVTCIGCKGLKQPGLFPGIIFGWFYCHVGDCVSSGLLFLCLPLEYQVHNGLFFSLSLLSSLIIVLLKNLLVLWFDIRACYWILFAWRCLFGSDFLWW